MLHRQRDITVCVFAGGGIAWGATLRQHMQSLGPHNKPAGTCRLAYTCCTRAGGWTPLNLCDTLGPKLTMSCPCP
jgi:hypothetical protein